VDAKCKPVTLKLLNSKQIMTGKPDRAILEGWWTQVGKNASIKDLKRRCVDTLNAAGF